MKSAPILILILSLTTAFFARQTSAPNKPAQHGVHASAKHDPQTLRPMPVVSTSSSSPLVARDMPFPDVPRDHWAYQSVETLRRAGIVHGYPSASK